MIQRIQSIYLLLVLILGVLCFFIPYATFYVSGLNVASIVANGVVFNQYAAVSASINMTLLVIITFAIILLTLIIIFLYKKRILQLKLIKLNMVFVIGSFISMFLYADIIKTAINADLKYYFAAAFPIISLVLLYLAHEAIKKDEELVKAADRLR